MRKKDGCVGGLQCGGHGTGAGHHYRLRDQRNRIDTDTPFLLNTTHVHTAPFAMLSRGCTIVGALRHQRQSHSSGKDSFLLSQTVAPALMELASKMIMPDRFHHWDCESGT